MTDTKESTSYAELGASSSKAGMLEALSLSGSSRYFAEPIDDVAGDPAYFSVLHADGAGTKSLVAYLAYRETGDAAWFRGLAEDSLVMNLDDVACIGAFEGLALSNTVGRNKRLIPDEVVGVIVDGYRDLAARLATAGITVRLAGGETADMGDAIRTLVVDSTLFARVKRTEIIDTTRVADGDIIIGLSNTGRASYETRENSSMGSNGLTLARHALIRREYAEKYPEIVDPGLKSGITYRGTAGLFDKIPGSSHTIAEALLSPTRTYAPIVRHVHQRLGQELHAAIHCSGGGLTKIARFGTNKHYIKDNLFPVPPLFAEIQRSASVPWQEMYAVFNMGHRMELVCPPGRAGEVAAIAAEFGVESREIGRVADAANGNRVTLRTLHGVFEY